MIEIDPSAVSKNLELAIKKPRPQIKHRYRFSHAHRLHGRRAFSAVYDAKMRKSAGPLLVFTRPNGLPHHRLGLSVSRRVGHAVTRSKHKRMLREAFRLSQPDWPRSVDGGLDLVVVVRPHVVLSLDDYRRLLKSAVDAAVRGWTKRHRPPLSPPPAPPASVSETDGSRPSA